MPATAQQVPGWVMEEIQVKVVVGVHRGDVLQCLIDQFGCAERTGPAAIVRSRLGNDNEGLRGTLDIDGRAKDCLVPVVNRRVNQSRPVAKRINNNNNNN